MATPRYRLVERCYLKADHTQESFLHEAGEEVEYSGSPGRNFVPLNTEAEANLALLTPLTDMAKNVLPKRGDPSP